MFYTARQMKQEFGIENLSDEVRKALEAKEYTKKFEVVHCVYPREDYDTEKKDQSGMPFVSEYYEVSSKHLLKSGGLKTIKYRIGRFDRSPDELMGRSPAMDLLPDIKMLNDMRYTFVQSSELSAMPPILLEDDSVVGQPSAGPGDIIYYRSGATKPEPFKTGANPQLTNEVILLERQGIMEGFYNDLFQALAQYRNMTAYEVSQRIEEKMVMLAPTISGLQKEMFDPLIMDIYNMLVDSGKIETIGVDVDIVYQGRLALAMSNMQTNAIEMTIAKWSPYQQFYPVLDNINLDKAFSISALNAGVPADLLLSEREVAANRENDMKMKQMQQQAEIAATGSQAIKNVAGTKYEQLI
jgi:hypothetical protein